VQVTTLVLSTKEFQCFDLCQPPTTLRVVLQYEVHEWLPNDHADLRRLARSLTCMTATTLVDSDVLGVFNNNVSCHWVWDYLFSIWVVHIVVKTHNSLSLLLSQYLAVIVISPMLPVTCT
jgi:hypothetical protein